MVKARKAIAVAIILTIMFGILPTCVPILNVAHAAGQVKNMEFYLHYVPNPPKIGGVVSNYIIDTSKTFQTVKNNDVKAIGQPKIQLDFYMYPAFAGPVELNGIWQAIIFANSTALHPATWGIQFWEKSQTGSIVWNSGPITPNVAGGPSGNPGYIDSPIYAYTLSTGSLNHVFSQGNTLEVEITVNTGATVPLRLWYDSPFYPSRLVLPSNSYATVSSTVTQDANGTARTVFFAYWSSDQRKVLVQALVTDPFGGYDINKVQVRITDSAGTIVVNNATMQRVAGGTFSYQNLYQYIYSYSNGARQGNYSVLVTAIDNNGQNQFEALGHYQPPIEYGSTQFAIGVQYSVSVKVVDSHGFRLNNARVEFFSSGLRYASGFTNANGYLNITLFSGSFITKVSWQEIQVAEQNLTIRGQTLIAIPTNVYNPTFVIRTDLGRPVEGAMSFIGYPNQTNGRLPLLSNSLGSISLSQQPAGNFSLLVFFDGTRVADTTLTVNSDGPYSVRAQIHQLKVNVTDSSNSKLSNATIVVRSAEGTNSKVYDYGLTSDGTVSFDLPTGNYFLQAEYHNVYWLSYASNTTRIKVSHTTNQIVPISMRNIPLPIWSTIGFWLIIATVALISVVAIYVARTRIAVRSHVSR